MARDDTLEPAPLNYENDFWRFSVAVYGAEGVAGECLSLQDRAGIDVNVLLFCVWLGRRGLKLRRQDIELAVSAVADWQGKVVRPLRSVRRFTKAECDDEVFRASLKEIEIRAEQVEQAILFSLSGRLTSAAATTERRTVIARNIESYIAVTSAAATLAFSSVSVHHLVEAALRFR